MMKEFISFIDFTNMSDEEKLQLEQECLLKYSKAQMIQKYIDELEENKQLHSIIKEVREYIENNSLYEEDYDYDYEENLVVGPPSDETARKILLEILDKVGGIK